MIQGIITRHEKQQRSTNKQKQNTSRNNLPKLGFCQEKRNSQHQHQKKTRKWETRRVQDYHRCPTWKCFSGWKTVLEPPTLHWNFVFCIRIWILCIMRKLFDNFLQIRNKSPTKKNFGDGFCENGYHVLILSDSLSFTGYIGKAPEKDTHPHSSPPPKSENCLITHEEFHRAEVCGRRNLENLWRGFEAWRTLLAKKNT